MKKLFFIFLLLIAHYSLPIDNCFSQLPSRYYWRQVTSPSNANLNYISTNNGGGSYYVAGNNGTLMYSYNGWTFNIFPGLENINLNCIDYTMGIYTAVGQNGIIYSYNGWGYPINTEISGTTENLMSIAGNRVSNSLPILFNRIAVGVNGTILKSTRNIPANWGPWNPIVSGTSQNLNSINFYNYISQLIVPFGCIVGDNGTILRTTNWGDNWNIIDAGITNKLNYIHFSDSMTCWITGSNGLFMKSTNRGLNWVTIPTGSTVNLKSCIISIHYFPTIHYEYFLCGNGGVILQSSNNGVSWINNQSPTLHNLNSTSYYYLIVGDSGTILRRDEDSSYILEKLEGNNISSYFINTGIIDQNNRSGNLAGFEWPKGSNKTAIYTAGLSTAGICQGQLREAMASYKGEYYPGACFNGVPIKSDTFKIYSVKREDAPAPYSDWLNWGLMVPYGAPFVDVNNNGIYDPQIDTPGVKGASQTIFLCMTDGFPESHTSGEGFGGGTAPLYSEIHLTAWCYSQPTYNDMQFLKYVVINKGTQPWTRTYFSLVSDPDLGDGFDDYIGCDTSRNLGFCYNATNYDGEYGTAPPAVGFQLLKGAYNKYSNPPKQLDMTSFIHFQGTSTGPPYCETDPNGEALPAYRMMQGYKKDSTCWLDPTQLIYPPNFYKKTKFIYYGDPETNQGWTEAKGRIYNCSLDTSGNPIIPNPSGDRRMSMNSGADNLTVMPGDTQTIVICQLIAKGSSNLNSVTKLKQLADVARQLYNSGYVIGINKTSSEVPLKFRLEQNYPNPFNPTTKIKFDIANPPFNKGGLGGFVTLKVYDITGREIQTLVNEKLNPGMYEVTFDGTNLSSGVYFYQLKTNNFTETKKLILLK